jgi:hypothetical protein
MKKSIVAAMVAIAIQGCATTATTHQPQQAQRSTVPVEIPPYMESSVAKIPSLRKHYELGTPENRTYWKHHCHTEHASGNRFCRVEHNFVGGVITGNPYIMAVTMYGQSSSESRFMLPNHHPGTSGYLRVGNNKPVSASNTLDGMFSQSQTKSLIRQMMEAETTGEKLC